MPEHGFVFVVEWTYRDDNDVVGLSLDEATAREIFDGFVSPKDEGWLSLNRYPVDVAFDVALSYQIDERYVMGMMKFTAN